MVYEVPPPARVQGQLNGIDSTLAGRIKNLKVSVSSPDPENALPFLPAEVVSQILSNFPPGRLSQSTLYACTLVSHLWYSAAIARLYECPWINGKNFIKFADIICPSVNAHIRTNGLSNFVKILDMSKLVHDGSQS